MTNVGQETMNGEQREALREALADYAHEAWAGWMRYLWSKTEDCEAADGAVIIPAPFVNRWTRQMSTPYADLPENEKTSDRAEADKMLAIMDGMGLALPADVATTIRELLTVGAVLSHWLGNGTVNIRAREAIEWVEAHTPETQEPTP